MVIARGNGEWALGGGGQRQGGGGGDGYICNSVNNKNKVEKKNLKKDEILIQAAVSNIHAHNHIHSHTNRTEATQNVTERILS